jgi:AraC-like DNA-binding protein
VLLTLTAGEAVLQYRGAVHTLQPGGVLLVEPGEVHRDLSKSSYRAEMVVIHADLVAALRGTGPGRYLGPGVTQDAALRKALLELVQVVQEQRAACEQERYAAHLFQRLMPHWATRPPQLEPPLVTRTRRLFLENPDCSLSLQELAGRLRCAPTYLCRVFTEHMGVGPHGYQVHYRLLLARALIESGKTVAEAAAQAGFNDESHLHRHFRRRFAAAPGRYHKALEVK